MSAKTFQYAGVFTLGCIYLLLQTTQVTAAPCEVEDRLAALEKKGRDQELLLFQQGQEIQRLKTEVKINKEEIQKYKQQTESQAKTIQQQERKLTDQAARLEHHSTYNEQTHRDLTLYKTQLTMQAKQIRVLEQALNMERSTLVNTLNEAHEMDKPIDGLMKNENNQTTIWAKTDQGQKMASVSKGTPTGKQKRLVLGNIEGPIAFHATTDKEVVTHVGINQNIVLDLVLLNLGSAYHNQSGVFIAPVDGVYLFSASILSGYDPLNALIDVNLFKNGQVLGRFLAHGDSGNFDQGAITVVTQVSQGDEVWLSDYFPADTSYYGARYTSFSGYLIAQI